VKEKEVRRRVWCVSAVNGWFVFLVSFRFDWFAAVAFLLSPKGNKFIAGQPLTPSSPCGCGVPTPVPSHTSLSFAAQPFAFLPGLQFFPSAPPHPLQEGSIHSRCFFLLA
jgi:hypothetical protein